MEIKWHNIFSLVFLIFTFILLMKFWNAIGAFLMTMRNIGPDHTPEEQVPGLIAFGLIIVLLVAIVKLLTSGNGNKS